MTCSGYVMCFKLGDNEHCVCIPQLIDWDWKNPRRWDRVFFDSRILTREEVKQLTVLASISELVTELPGNVGREIQKGVATQMQAFNAKLAGALSISQYKGQTSSQS